MMYLAPYCEPMRARRRPERTPTPRPPAMLWVDAGLFAIASSEHRAGLQGLLTKAAEAHLAVERAFARLSEAERRRARAEAANSWKPAQRRRVSAPPDDF